MTKGEDDDVDEALDEDAVAVGLPPPLACCKAAVARSLRAARIAARSWAVIFVGRTGRLLVGAAAVVVEDQRGRTDDDDDDDDDTKDLGLWLESASPRRSAGDLTREDNNMVVYERGIVVVV